MTAFWQKFIRRMKGEPKVRISEKEKKPQVAPEGKKLTMELEHRAAEILLRPVITEKTGQLMGMGQYVFEVPLRANAVEIKKAVERAYKTKVEDVNIISVKGKKTRFRGLPGKRSDWKKAVVRLSKGERISLE